MKSHTSNRPPVVMGDGWAPAAVQRHLNACQRPRDAAGAAQRPAPSTSRSTVPAAAA